MSIRASHKHKAPKSAYREVGFMIFVTLVPWPVLTYVLPAFGYNFGFTVTNMIWAMGISGFLTFLLWFIGFNRRRNSELLSDIDYDNGSIKVWMRKPSPVWKDKLGLNNDFKIEDEVISAQVEKINNNRTLIVGFQDRGQRFYLPQRLAVQPEVKKFFETYIDSEKGKAIKQRSLIEKFINGDEGIVVRDASLREKPKTISELIEDEKVKEQTQASLSDILAKEDALRAGQETNR